MDIWLHPEAEQELTRAAVYYAEHASPRIANAFLVEFERVLEILKRNQQLGTPTEQGLRIHRLYRFPYSIVYREAEAALKIYAISHQSRQPAYWQGRF